MGLKKSVLFAGLFIVVLMISGSQASSQAGQSADDSVSSAVTAEAVKRVHKALSMASGAPVKQLEFSGTNQPVTGEQLTAMLYDVMGALEGKIKYKPIPEPFDPRIEELFTSTDSKARFARLGEWGLVAPVGPIAIKQQRPMTSVEVGDAIGLFYTQMAEYTSMPDPRHTLFLMGPDDLNEYYGYPPEDSAID